MTHYHVIVWCYDRIEPGSGNYINNVVVDLIAESTLEALKRAEGMIPGKGGYCVRSVIQHFDSQCRHEH